MMWLGLAAALIVTIVLQTTVCQLFDIPLIDVDLLLALTLIYGVLAPPRDARIAGWIIGFAMDLATEGPLGLFALAFGLTALLMTKMRDAVNVQVWWVRLFIGFLAAVPGQLLIPLHLWAVQGAHLPSAWRAVWAAVVLSGASAFVAASVTAFSPFVPRRRVGRHTKWATD